MFAPPVHSPFNIRKNKQKGSNFIKMIKKFIKKFLTELFNLFTVLTEKANSHRLSTKAL